MGSLDIEQNLAGQAAVWCLQRWARAAVVVFLAAGVAGVFGGGWIGDERVADDSGALTVTHSRLARMLAPCELEVEVDRRLVKNGEVELWFDQAALDRVEIEGIRPEPIEQTAAAGKVTYRFRADGAGEPAVITFHLTTRKMGYSRGRLGVSDGPHLTLARFIYP